jgi:hypothetical protein
MKARRRHAPGAPLRLALSSHARGALDERVQVEGLLEDRPTAGFGELYRGVIVRIACRKDHSRDELRRLFYDTPVKLAAGNAWHSQVRDYDVELARVRSEQRSESFVAIEGFHDVPSPSRKKTTQRAPDRCVVFGYEDAIARPAQAAFQNPASARPSGDSRSFSNARSRICRIRSRVTPISAPIRSSVIASPVSSRP